MFFMQLHGKTILWSHIVSVYESEEDQHLKQVHKLTKDHVKLTSYSRMKVRYATQVTAYVI
jgi:hypothetical protein